MTDILDRREFATMLAAASLAPTLNILRLNRSSRLTPIAPINAPNADFLKGLARLMEIAGVPGVGVSVVQDRRVVWQHHQGVIDTTTGQAVSPDTMWPAASLSKPVFALAALHLVDEGKLDLDRPLKSYVSDHAPADARGDKITVRQVLSHSSGLRNWRNRVDQPLVPDFEPGARFQYSGEGFYYLQRAVEHIVGTSFAQFMEERLLTPLGMKSSTFLWRPEANTKLVSGHDRGDIRTNFSKDLAARLQRYADEKKKPLVSFTHEDMAAAMQTLTPAPPILPNFLIPNAAASLLTTTGDYANFLIEVLNGGNVAVDLKPATRDQMMSPHVRINSALAWGLGWGLEQSGTSADEKYLWHWGDNGAWKNFVLAHPATRSAVVVFTNGSRGLNIAQRIVNAASGRECASFLWL